MSDVKSDLIAWAGIAAIGLVLGGVVNTLKYFHVTESTAKIERLERVQQNNGGKYLVFSDKGTYEVTDSLFMWRWDSSDVYGKLKEGSCYDFKLRGWRIGFLSMYPNIDTATKKECVE